MIDRVQRAKRLEEVAPELTSAEAKAMQRAIVGAAQLADQADRTRMLDLITDIGCSWGGHRHKVARDRANDLQRRVLVGARLPRDTVDQYRAQAAAEGVSLYAWVAAALAAYARGRHDVPRR